MPHLRGAVTGLVCALFMASGDARGQLAFEEQPPVVVGAAASGGICAEMDGRDGPDVVVTAADRAGVVVALNDGAGGFASLVTIDGPARAVAPGDWDDDGPTDLLTIHGAGGDGRLELARQVTSGAWHVVATRSLGYTPVAVATADVDGDGLVDVAIGNGDAAAVHVYRNDGSGGLDGLASASYPVGDPFRLVLRDLNADGGPDLVVLDRANGRLRIRLGTGGGAFGLQTVFFLSGGPSDLACADLTGDGFPDLAVARTTDGLVSIFRNDGAGGFASAVALPVAGEPAGLAAGDLDCDGDVDLLVRRTGPPWTLDALLNGGTGDDWVYVPDVVDHHPAAPVVSVTACEFDGAPGTDLVAVTAGDVAAIRRHVNIDPRCAACLEPPGDVLAWWTGDDCQPDDHFGHHDGAYVGVPPCPADGLVGNGAIGLGARAYVEVASDCDLDPGDGDFSIDAWVRTDATGDQPIASKGAAPGYALEVASGRARFVVRDETQGWTTRGSARLDDGAWHHVAVTIERGAATTIRLWVDGILADTTLAPLGPVASPHPLLLGAGPSPAPTDFLGGDLDEVQILPRALTAAEVQAVYHARIAGQCRPVCQPESDLPDTDLWILNEGEMDGFTLPGEPTMPGPELAPFCAGTVDFDEFPVDGSVCQTFRNLPGSIVSGRLELRLRASPTGAACDDTISLQVTDGEPGFAWTRRLGGPHGCAGDAGLMGCPWAPLRTRTVCLDLSALPRLDGGTTSLLDDMNVTGRLDVRVAEDTAVDFISLRFLIDECPADVNADGTVGFEDMLDVLSSWGPCAEPCPPCAGDANGDCEVDFADMLIVLGAWGTC